MFHFEKQDLNQLLSKIHQENNPKNDWIFDCDGTLVNGDISIHTGWLIIRSGLVDIELLPKEWQNSEKLRQMSLEEFEEILASKESTVSNHERYIWEINLQSGFPFEQVIDFAREGLDYGVKTKTLNYTNPLSKLAKEVADQAYVVSGSSHPTVCAVVETLNFPPERVFATQLEIVDGIYQKQFAPPGIVWEEVKSEVLASKGIENPWFVAGDTIGDWSMLISSERWSWCVLWDRHRHRGEEFREHIESSLLSGEKIPTEAGYHLCTIGEKNWIFEVKGGPDS